MLKVLLMKFCLIIIVIGFFSVIPTAKYRVEMNYCSSCFISVFSSFMFEEYSREHAQNLKIQFFVRTRDIYGPEIIM